MRELHGNTRLGEPSHRDRLEFYVGILYHPGSRAEHTKGGPMSTRMHLVTAALLISAVMFGQSQANNGTIEGIVADPAGRAVPKAAFTLTNTGTNFTRVLTTDDEGRFRGLLLPLGPYKVTVKATNFGVAVREGMDLAVGQSISLPIALSLSQVGQVVSVT